MPKGYTISQCPYCGDRLYSLYVQYQKDGELNRINPYMKYCIKCKVSFKVLILEAIQGKVKDNKCRRCGEKIYKMHAQANINNKNEFKKVNLYYCCKCDIVFEGEPE